MTPSAQDLRDAVARLRRPLAQPSPADVRAVVDALAERDAELLAEKREHLVTINHMLQVRSALERLCDALEEGTDATHEQIVADFRAILGLRPHRVRPVPAALCEVPGCQIARSHRHDPIRVRTPGEAR